MMQASSLSCVVKGRAVMGARVELSIGYPSPGGGSLAVWAAVREGLFRARGIDAELVLYPGSASVVGGLLRAEVAFANIASPAVLEANLTIPGADLVYLTGALNHFSHILVGAGDIDGLAQLRGRRLGARVSGSDVLDLDLTLWRYLLGRAGLDPRRDVEFVEVSTHADLVRGVTTGTIDAAVIIPPHAFEAERLGARVILEGPSLGLPFQLGGLVASRAYAQADPDLALAACQAYADGVRLVKGDAELARALVRQHAQIADETTVARTADFFQRAFVTPPVPSLDGIATVLDSLCERLPAACGSSPADHVWLDPIQALGP